MLDVQNLCKSIDKAPFFSELTFQVGSGESLILLGRNGAGKTLLLNILATLVEPTSGSIALDGVDVFTNLKRVRPRIGYIPVGFEGYAGLSVLEYLNFFAAAYQLERSARASALDAVLELMDIRHLRDARIARLSTGERQRLLFAKTFLHEPKVWLLDDPFGPLDPDGQAALAALLDELQAMGNSLVIASNRLEDVDRVSAADPLVGILEGGEFAVLARFGELPRGDGLNQLFLEVTKG